MKAFQWLDDLIRWFASFFPRLAVVPPTHNAVLFGRRGVAVARPPGFVLWWPFFQRLRLVPTAVQAIQSSARCLPCLRDGAALPTVAVIGLGIEFRIADSAKAATAAIDITAIVDNRVQSALGRAWAKSQDPYAAALAAAESVRRRIRIELGVELLRVEPTHAGTAVAHIRLADYTTEGVDSAHVPAVPGG